ncbi:MAG: hypothetical protein NOF05_02670 [Candidatus Accumulibacter phosphatis]|uniref:Uncharacterized protein n=2 Tax=Candidatus Accumulibacter TaxID=327159 RepID=A0A7D5N982_9PROT|nr:MULTISPECIES: hypothetical protein [Candidatus Accumulibacter]QLH49134.1 MAG: hypothetical protein HWD57_04570 [Candidatus Accumulibacter cognatus]MBL8402228.1 hypothetical protein [Accumulibacter sp.]MCC2867752.1 hypothetical protein [Candidatus Accumulibacter phosphatis]MCQ1547731.1 hypothetical protein [Candidatus Accumulibacter phosphatis]TMQ74613.1 hypothetical protein ACCUM_4133 [Candidatus Accumulibacter phosphatis]
MLIGGVLSAGTWISRLGQLIGNSETNTAQTSNGAEAYPPIAPPSGGGMLDAVTQALATIGVGSSSSTSGKTASASSSTEDPAQALVVFMDTLMAALHAQSVRAATKDANSSIAGSSNDQRHNIQSDMQRLIETLASSPGNSTGSGASESSAGTLQQSFQKLLSAAGGSSSNATLSDFLQAFARNLPGASSVGNVVSTRV